MNISFQPLKRGLFPLFMMALLSSAFSQDLTINSVSIKGNDVIIHYDLLDDDLSRKYTLWLYSSVDNYVQPLTKVEGDIGIDLAVGGNKLLIWHAKEELGEEFKGDVALEIKGKRYIPFVTLNNFEDINSMKRGRPYNITWTAGRGSSVLTFDLFNNKDEIVHTYTNIANVGEYQLELPGDIKPGKDYRFRITDQRNKEDVVHTPVFTVKRKVPLYAKVALFGLVGSGILILGQQGSGPANGEIPLLPDPILPTN
ncbi:MAG: Ser-Thr-rich GPI-anchored membrane family protein [Ekhidna sp.]